MDSSITSDRVRILLDELSQARTDLKHGSLFWVTARLRKGGSPSEATNNAENITPALIPLEDRILAKFEGTKILLAEDDLISSAVALELLHLAGLNVDTASNGQEAITQAQCTNALMH